MTARHIAALVLLGLGCALLLLSVLALLVLPGPFTRLHAPAAATSAGAPLVAAALAVQAGPGRAALKLLVIGAVLAAGGPVTGAAIGRLAAQHRDVVEEDSPE